MVLLSVNRVDFDPWETADHNPMLPVQDSPKKAPEKLHLVFNLRDPLDRYFHAASALRISIRGVQSVY
jgi:hypothetical protein